MREVQCRSVLVCREDLLDKLLKTAYSEKKMQVVDKKLLFSLISDVFHWLLYF